MPLLGRTVAPRIEEEELDDRDSKSDVHSTMEMWDLATNDDTEFSLASGLGERSSNLLESELNFNIPEERMRPFSFITRRYPTTLNPEPVADTNEEDLTPLLTLTRQNAVVAERVSNHL
jgi:hypothetical protein